MFDDFGKAVEGQHMNPADYAHEEVHARIDQVVDYNHLLLNINEAHCGASAQSFCNFTLDYAPVVMTIYFLTAVNQVGTTFATAVHHIDGKIVIKNDCRVFMLGDLHSRR